MLWLLDTPSVSGLFNLGTGIARTYLDLAHAVCRAAGKPEKVDFIDMPANLRDPVPILHPGHHRTGCARQAMPASSPRSRNGIRRYVQDYLATTGPLPVIPVLLFPEFDPVIVHLGPLAIRWYALAYILGLVLGWRLLRRLVQQTPIGRHYRCRRMISSPGQPSASCSAAVSATSCSTSPLHYLQDPLRRSSRSGRAA